MQNAVAAEQHVKDMADYELKLTEAAAAWEADRKKKKGKAKEEVSCNRRLATGSHQTIELIHTMCMTRHSAT